MSTRDQIRKNLAFCPPLCYGEAKREKMPMPPRTKIICTIGPAVNTFEKILELIEAGMNVARLNFSHGTHEQHLETIANLKRARTLTGKPLAIMLDTKGPEIRVGKIKDGELFLTPGQRWLLVKDPCLGDESKVSITPGTALDGIHKGATILFDDGYISSQVVDITPEGIVVEVDRGGLISSGKGVNVPNVNLHLPAVTDRDIADIRFGCEQDVDLVAASFIRSAEHVLTVKKLLADQGKSNILVIAKIENAEGVKNFDNIVQVADGIMVARGDLGVEVPLSQVPKLQKMMIRKSYLAGKPTITATQMLESMIHSSRPTRAEVSDVANAIYDSTSAVMLSGETAIGHYPIETVRVMTSILYEAEMDFDYRTHFDLHAPMVYNDVPSAVTLATVKTAYSSNARAIFVFSSGGGTVRLLSRLRPDMPIVALTPDEKTYHQLAFNWGVTSVKSRPLKTVEEAFEAASSYALEHKIISYGDLVVLTAGTPFGISGTTNMMVVESIGDVLVRGDKGVGTRTHGNVVIAFSPEEKPPYAVRDQLLIIPRCDESFLPLIHEAAGIILQNSIDDTASEEMLLELAEKLDKPAITRAGAASETLTEGQLVTLDPEKALVYKGVVL